MYVCEVPGDTRFIPSTRLVKGKKDRRTHFEITSQQQLQFILLYRFIFNLLALIQNFIYSAFFYETQFKTVSFL